MELFFSRRNFSGVPIGQTSFLASVRTEEGSLENRLLQPKDWARLAFRKNSRDEVLIFVHGYNTGHAFFKERLRKIRKETRKAGYPGEIIGFEWPSLSQLLSYDVDRKRAKAESKALVEDGIRFLKEHNPNAKISILAHSMGAYLTVCALLGAGNGERLVDKVVFVAADVSMRNMRVGERAARALKPSCESVTNYCSMFDLVLDTSRGVMNNRQRRCGQHGMDDKKPTRFYDVDCSARFKSIHPWENPEVRASHTWYFEDSVFYNDLVAVLKGKGPEGLPTRKPGTQGDHVLLPAVAETEAGTA